MADEAAVYTLRLRLRCHGSQVKRERKCESKKMKICTLVSTCEENHTQGNTRVKYRNANANAIDLKR